MSRLSHPFVVVSLGAGIVLAALAATHVLAQSTDPGLRPTAEGDQDTPGRSGKGKSPAKKADPTKAGQIPSYGIPPASGAGRTGFDSTNAKKRKSKKANARAPNTYGPALTLPLPISPPATFPPPSTTPTTGPAATPAQPPAQPAARSAAAAQTPGVTPRPVVRKKPPVEVDPFEQLGIRAGAFILRPSIETIGGYDSNPARTTGGRGSWYTMIVPEFQARSDWQRHELGATIRGSYTAYESASSLNHPNLDAKIFGRIDVTNRTRVDFESRFLLSTDDPGSPNLPAGLAKLPIFTVTGGTLGVTQRLNRFELALKVSFDRTEYQNSKLTDGSTVDNTDRNFDQTGAVARASYELTPGIKPFVEFAFDTRRHDLPVDRSGDARDSQGWTEKVGTTFELTRILTGEIAVGYLVRAYKDSTLPDLRGLVGEASLVWVATGLTTVKLTGKTTAEESTLVGVSGVLRRDLGLQVDHAFRRWLIGTAKLGYGLDDYEGSSRVDTRYSASTALLYKLTRSLQLKGELRQEWLRSNTPGNDYTASIALVGLRWQP